MVLYLVAFFLFGTILGSFFNALVWRFLRRDRSIAEKHSVCIHCGHTLAPYDLIPVASYVLLFGRCRYCHKSIPWHYPVVEIATGAVVVLPFLVWGFSWKAGAAGMLALVLLPLFLLDLRYKILPDVLTLPGLLVGIVVGIAFHRTFESIVIGGILGAGFFALQYAVSRGKWIGDGDIRLGGIMGLALGWQLVLVALALAYVSGAAVSVLLLSTGKKQWTSELPFGVFLTCATYAALLWGTPALNAYLQAIGVV